MKALALVIAKTYAFAFFNPKDSPIFTSSIVMIRAKSVYCKKPVIGL